MYGDYAPLDNLHELLEAYDNFYLYIDDAHGMSWTGKNGKGYVLEKIPPHEKMIVITSLNKAFCGVGGVAISSSSIFNQLMRNCGGPFIFSTPIFPPALNLYFVSIFGLTITVFVGGV